MINAGPIFYTDRMATALPPAVAAAVRRAARHRGVPVAQYLREAVAAQLVADGVVQTPPGRPVSIRRARSR